MRSGYRCVYWVAILAVIPGFASAEQMTLLPERDVTLYQSPAGALANGAGSFFFVGSTNTDQVRRAVLFFNIASQIPAGSTITDVVLECTLSRTISGANDVSLHKALQNWGEGTSNATGEEGQGANSTTGDATWLHTFFNTSQWSTAGGDFEASARATTSVGAEGAYQWTGPNLVADAQAWLDSPENNFGWFMIGNESSTASAQRFNAKEFGTASQRPKLIISFSTGNAFEKWVNFGFAGTELGTESNPFNTLAEAVSAVSEPGSVFIAAGSSGESISISKAVTLQAIGGPVRIGAASRSQSASTDAVLGVAHGGTDVLSTNRPRKEARWKFIPLRSVEQRIEDGREPDFYPEAGTNETAFAAPADALWARVRASEPIAPESLEVTVDGAGDTAYEAFWEPAVDNDLRQLWVGVTPGEAWPAGADITLRVEGKTDAGTSIEPILHTWSIQD